MVHGCRAHCTAECGVACVLVHRPTFRGPWTSWMMEIESSCKICPKIRCPNISISTWSRITLHLRNSGNLPWFSLSWCCRLMIGLPNAVENRANSTNVSRCESVSKNSACSSDYGVVRNLTFGMVSAAMEYWMITFLWVVRYLTYIYLSIPVKTMQAFSWSSIQVRLNGGTYNWPFTL